MTALAQEWAPGYAHPGARPFENGPDQLALVGVDLAPEQLDLLERAARFRPGWHQRMYAMVLVPMNDPVKFGAELLGIKAQTLDDQGAEAVVVPGVLEVDCSDWEAFDESEPHWRRFPSILGRVHVYSAVTGTVMEGLRPFRIWDAWPLEDEWDADIVKDALTSWSKYEWDPYLKWLEADDVGTSLACDYEGTPAHLHDHEYDDSGHLAACRDGDSWFEHYKLTELVSDHQGELYHRPFGPMEGLRHLQLPYERLLASSKANTYAALSAYPEWEQDQIALTERHYSPWLLSY